MSIGEKVRIEHNTKHKVNSFGRTDHGTFRDDHKWKMLINCDKWIEQLRPCLERIRHANLKIPAVSSS